MAGNNGVKLFLKMFNSAMGIGGIATVMYGVLMFRAWQLQGGSSSFHHIPWFFHAFLGVGILLCAITCLGHIAANRPNISWLSAYIILLLFLLILETLIMADSFANPNWEKELPTISLSNRLDDFFMDFVASCDIIWNWLAWSVFLIQATCVLLATLRIQETNEVDSDDTEEEEDSERIVPLLGPSARYHNIV
ncbi:hypothetical protein ACS0TY_032087 [Phlomoides rotata]